MSVATIQQLQLATRVTSLPGVGPKVAERLGRLGITTAKELLFHWPRRWIDLTNPSPIASLRRDREVVVRGTLNGITADFARGRKRARVQATLTDSAGDTLSVIWFNQTYLTRVLKDGQSVLLVGKAQWNWQTRQLQLTNPKLENHECVLPIYPETAGLTSAFLRKLITPLLSRIALPDPLPFSDQYPALTDAVRHMHAPATLTDARRARHRLALDELLALQYIVRSRRVRATAQVAPAITIPVKQLQTLVKRLPFTLTNGQRIAAWQILGDLEAPVPMQRLLQGDVGTGKTVVGALVATAVLESGHNVAWLAPTQVLARQLHARLRSMLEECSYTVDLVTAGTVTQLPNRPTLFVGTHALLARDSVKNLGLVLVDEQHRFGVAQRQQLVKQSTGTVPHMLAMTATPIPRTLALTIYGDVDVASLRERPAHQQPVTTVQVAPDQNVRIQRTLQEALDAGQQAFVVVPRIGRSTDSLFAKSLQDTVAQYQSLLPSATIQPFHGQLDEKEKETVMARFVDGSIDVLVATSIVEVGIDVPNATVMVIEEAERFGLAQLHQLRGRIGRGDRAGRCLVRSYATDPVTSERIEAFCRTSDGYELADLDLRLRGPGDLLGTVQSGLPPLKLARLTDHELVERAGHVAGQWLSKPPPHLADFLRLYAV